MTAVNNFECFRSDLNEPIRDQFKTQYLDSSTEYRFFIFFIRRFDTRFLIRSSAQVKGSIVRERILTDTYTLRSTRHTFSKMTINPTCLQSQFEDKDLHYPWQNKYINQIKMVQYRAVRYIFNDYQHTSSVTSMLNKLSLPTH